METEEASLLWLVLLLVEMALKSCNGFRVGLCCFFFFFFFVYHSNSNQTISNIPPNHRGISGTTATDKKEEETCLVPLSPSTSYLHSNSTTTTTYDFRSPLLTSLFLTLPRSLWDPSFLFQPITAFSLLRIRVVSTAHAFLHLHSTALPSNHSPPFLLLTTPSLLLKRGW